MDCNYYTTTTATTYDEPIYKGNYNINNDIESNTPENYNYTID